VHEEIAGLAPYVTRDMPVESRAPQRGGHGGVFEVAAVEPGAEQVVLRLTHGQLTAAVRTVAVLGAVPFRFAAFVVVFPGFRFG
jgi:hypothetical protein